jgi:hypothetical protein
MTVTRAQLRTVTRSGYDLQKLRIATGLRLCANIRVKLGQQAGDKEEDLEIDAQQILDHLRLIYKRLTDGVASNRELPSRRGFRGDGVITSYTELVLAKQYFDLLKSEMSLFGELAHMLESFPVYVQYLHEQRGVGPTMAAVLLSEFDPTIGVYPSSFWKYAGLDVGPDGRGRSRRAEHLVMRAYTDAKGEESERLSITFNPFLKTKLMGVLAPSFLRSKSPWSEVYYDVKHRYESDPRHAKEGDDTWTKGHIHQAALRYMVKIFLIDFHINWCRIDGLPVQLPYHEAKLGIVHGSGRE